MGKDDIAMQKKENYNKIRQLKLENEKKIKENRTQFINHAKFKRDIIASQKEQGKLRQQEFYEQKKEMIRKELDKKIQHEDDHKNKKLDQIKKMEEYEIDLIQRLKQTQNLQQRAYEELENALQLSAQEFHNMYLKQESEANEQEQEAGPAQKTSAHGEQQLKKDSVQLSSTT